MKTTTSGKRTALILALYLSHTIINFAFANTNSDACLPAPSATIIEGHVITKKPQAGVTVTVKDCRGLLVGSSVTDRKGHYSMTGNGNPPFFAQAMLRHNTPLYGYSYNGIINLDPVIDAIMTLWYRKKDYETDRIFEQLAQQPILPDPYEVASLYYQLFGYTDTKVNMQTIGRLNEPLTHQVKKAFRTVTITQHKTKIKVKHQNTQQTTVLSDESDHDHFIEFHGKIRSYSPHQKVVKTQDYTPLTTVSYNSDDGNNHAWMEELQPYIKDRFLSQIALPGTHDSGMYDCSGHACGALAQTQDRSITDQLNDGIRYFDFRVAEVAHRDCADPTAFQIYHGKYWGPDKRYNLIVSEIQQWLNKPAHSHEVLILDFQEILEKYNDHSATVVLLATIQKELGPFIRPIMDLQSTKISDLAGSARVFVLMQKESLVNLSSIYKEFLNNPDKLNRRCNLDLQSIKNATQNKLGERDLMLNSYYAGRDNSNELKDDIDSQVHQNKRSDIFNTYKSYQTNNLLNVLQIVFRPSNWWYTCVLLGACQETLELRGDPSTLMEYARRYNGHFSVVPDKNCYGGWLGKRVWMANNASGDQAQYWNRPNILIIDNYAHGGDWVSAYYENDKWHKEGVLGYVDFIKSINKNSHAHSMTYTPKLEDECLP